MTVYMYNQVNKLLIIAPHPRFHIKVYTLQVFAGSFIIIHIKIATLNPSSPPADL